MPNLNKYIQMGHLVRDPEVRQISDSLSVTEVTLATTDYIGKNQDGSKKESTVFMNWSIWGGQGELAAKVLRKGHAVLLSGRLRTDSWTDDSGNKRSRISATAQDMVLLTPKEKSSAAGDAKETKPSQPELDDKPPF